MSQVSLRPNGTAGSPAGMTINGAGSAHVALADGTIVAPNDSTYVTLPGTGGYLVLNLGTTPKPEGSRVRYLKWNVVDASVNSVATRLNIYALSGARKVGELAAYIPGDSFQPSRGAWEFVGDLTQQQINDLQLAMAVPVDRQSVKVSTAELVIVFQHKPVATITSAGGTITESSYTVEFEHTPGEDAEQVQDGWRVRVFSEEQYTADGFNVETSPAMIDVGGRGQVARHTIDGLSPGSYRVAVRTYQPYGNDGTLLHGSDYDTVDIEVDITTAEVAAVTIGAPDPDTGRIEGIIDRDPDSDEWDHVEVQRTGTRDLLDGIGDMETGSGGIATGWVERITGSPSDPLLSLETTDGIDGQYQRIQGGGTGTIYYGIETAEFFDVEPETAYVLQMRTKRTLTNAAHWRYIVWYDAAENRIGTGANLGATGDLPDWTFESLSGVSPANARKAKVETFGGRLSGGAAEWDISIDQLRLAPYESRWTDVRNADQLTPGPDQVSFVDYLAPPDVQLIYRARAVEANGNRGAWVYSDQAVTWSMTEGVWVKDPEEPARSMLLELFGPPNPVSPARGEMLSISGSKFRKSIAEQRGGRVLDLQLRTWTAAEARKLRALAERDILLIQFPAVVDFEPGYFRALDLAEFAVTDQTAHEVKHWVLQLEEVDEP